MKKKIGSFISSETAGTMQKFIPLDRRVFRKHDAATVMYLLILQSQSI